MTVPLPAPSVEGRHQLTALLQRFSRPVGFLITPIPGTGEPSPGTGLLVQFRDKKYFVSALHNFFYDIAPWNERIAQVVQSWGATRFKFRDDSPVGQVESLHEAVRRVKPEFGDSLPLALPEGLLIDAKHDLIAVRIDPSREATAHAEFLDLEKESFTGELTHGVSLTVVGVTLSSQVNVPGVGPTLIPQLDHVRFDSALDTSGTTHQWYSPEYFFIPYSLTRDRINPHGFSGAPIFVNKDSPSGLWMPSPHVVGITLSHFKSKDLLIAVKVSVVIDLLETDKA